MVSAYPTERQFLHDVQTVWSNCLTYCQGRYDNVVLNEYLSKVFRKSMTKLSRQMGINKPTHFITRGWVSHPGSETSKAVCAGFLTSRRPKISL